jgi:hypothetical protein
MSGTTSSHSPGKGFTSPLPRSISRLTLRQIDPRDLIRDERKYRGHGSGKSPLAPRPRVLTFLRLDSYSEIGKKETLCSL